VIDLKTIEALAPDQSSLSAASKLTKRSLWVRLEQQGSLLWGECQGSGANPYRVVVDASDQGYKCTCPSRKFPCKHSLALMWITATAPDQFTPGTDIPEWVNDWLGRRRKSSGGAAAPAVGAGSKSIDEAQAAPDGPDATAKSGIASRKRAADTRASVAAGLDELDQWITDQLRLGLAGFVDEVTERCRRIAARLVDAKAAGLASRVDELPAALLQLDREERPEAAIRELGKVVLLTKAWRAAPDDLELKGLVGSVETRDQILSRVDAVRVRGTWEVLGERIETRRDGLVSHATWLLQVATEALRFAVLQDYYPASAGRRSQAFSSGERFGAELAFYPARAPLRAVVADRGPATATGGWPSIAAATVDPLVMHQARQDEAPWSNESPILLPPGRLASDDRDRPWWIPRDNHGIALPVEGDVPEAALGMMFDAAAGLWNGARLRLLAASTDHGRLDLA
jgi:hypothetical protein